MAGSKVTTVGAAAAALATMEMYVNDSGTDHKITIQQLIDLFGDSISNQSTANQTPTAATLTLLTGSVLNVPPAKLRVGTIFIFRIALSKTAAGIAARSFFLKIGTTGTTSDATVLTFTQTRLPTAVADNGYIDIIVTIRTIGAAATLVGQLMLIHWGNTAGLASVPVDIITGTPATFDSTVANLKVSLHVTTGASEALTFTQVNAEAKNL